MQVLNPSNIWLQPHQHGSLFKWLEFVVLHYGLTPDILSRYGTVSLPTLPNSPCGRTSDGNSESVSEITHYCVIHSNSTAKAELLSREKVYFLSQRCQLSFPGFMRLAILEVRKTNKQIKPSPTLAPHHHTHTHKNPKQTNTKTTKTKTKQQLQNQY